MGRYHKFDVLRFWEHEYFLLPLLILFLSSQGFIPNAWRASGPRAVSMTSNPKKYRGRRGRRPSNAAQKTWRASGPRAVSMTSNPKINRGRQGRRPANAAQKNLEGERPASRFYDFEPEEKIADANAGVPPMRPMKFDLPEVARFCHKVAIVCHSMARSCHSIQTRFPWSVTAFSRKIETHETGSSQRGSGGTY